MSHPLNIMIGQVRRRSRLLVAAHALLRATAAFAAAVLVLGGIDWLVGFEDRGLRAIASLLLLVAAVLLARRVVRAVRASRWSDVQIAQRIERRFPALKDQLSSAVEFLRESETDPRAGSPVLRRRVISQVEADVGSYDLSTVFDARPAWRAAAVAMCAALAALILAALDPAAAATALARLGNPLNDVQWPKRNHLAFRDAPTRIASGGTFEVELIDELARPLPDEVRIHYRYADGVDGSETEVEAMQFIDGVMVARRADVIRPFEYRAEGGDDRSMPWRRLEVVEPPRPRGLNVELDHPDYTGWPTSDSSPNVRALTGTRMRFTGESSKPLRSAVVRLESGAEIRAQVAADGYSFTAPPADDAAFLLTESGSWTLDLEDREGFHGGRDERYELRAIVDAPPAVQFDSPSANVFVTPRAELPLRIVVKDDLAIRDVSLRFGEQVLPLFSGPPVMLPDERSAPPGQPEGDVRTVEDVWSLAPLGLSPGVEIPFRAEATDYLPQVGQSVERRLTVITDEQLQDRLADRQGFILGELGRIARMQQQARAQVAGLEIQLEQVGKLEQGDVDALQGVGLQQQQVARQLTGASEGVAPEVDDLLAEMRYNKIEGADLEGAMQDLRSLLGRLAGGPLPEASRELTAALKSAQQDHQGERTPNAENGDGSLVARALASAGARQQQVVESLEAALGELSQRDNYRRFRREVGQLQQDQAQLAQDTAQTGRETVTKQITDLTPQQQADLRRLAQRQFDLGRELDKLLERMRSTQQELGTDDASSEALGDALAEAARQALSGRMRSAGREVEQNRIGQAAAEQRELAERLAEMADTLASRPEHELARRVQKMRAAESQLADLAARQEGLRKKLRAAHEIADPEERRRELERLTREQRELEEQADRLGRELRRLLAERASQSAGRAAGRMAEAGRQGDQGDAGGAADQADAAQRDLEEAQQQLAEARKQAELDLAQEQLARMGDALRGLREREGRALEQTRQYDERRAEHNRLSRAEAASVRDLAAEQRELYTETRELSQTLAAVEVFKFVLEEAAADMQAAESRLARLDTGEATQRAEQRALTRIDQIMAALNPDGDQQTAEQAGGDSGAGGSAGEQGNQVRALAEVKLLRLMQQSLNDRTAALDAQRADGDRPSDEEKQEYARLSGEQGRLADLLLNLVEAADQPPEDDPESLPELDLGVRSDDNEESEKETPTP